MSAQHNEETLAHWAIRYESVRLRLAQEWGLADVAQHASYNLKHWQQRQQYLFDQAQNQSLF